MNEVLLSKDAVFVSYQQQQAIRSGLRLKLAYAEWTRVDERTEDWRAPTGPARGVFRRSGWKSSGSAARERQSRDRGPAVEPDEDEFLAPLRTSCATHSTRSSGCAFLDCRAKERPTSSGVRAIKTARSAGADRRRISKSPDHRGNLILHRGPVASTRDRSGARRRQPAARRKHPLDVARRAPIVVDRDEKAVWEPAPNAIKLTPRGRHVA